MNFEKEFTQDELQSLIHLVSTRIVDILSNSTSSSEHMKELEAINELENIRQKLKVKTIETPLVI